MKRYYIGYIKLMHFIPLKNLGPVYETWFDPNIRVNVFKGPVGVGKSTIVGNLHPFATMDGTPPILIGKDGEKEIVYINLDDPDDRIKIRHVFIPNKDKHTTKSFLYKMRGDNIIETVVNGSANDFKSEVFKVLNINEKKLKITGIGLKYGKQKHNLIVCSDTERFDFIKEILNNLEEVQVKEEQVTQMLQDSNRYIKEFKAILNNISKIDFNLTIDKIKNEINSYDEEKNILIKNKTLKEQEILSVTGIDISKKDEYIKELNILRRLKEIQDSMSGKGLVDEYKLLKEEYNSLNNIVIRDLNNIITNLKSNKLTLNFDKRFDDSETLETIDYQIQELIKTTNMNDNIDIDLLDNLLNELYEAEKHITSLNNDLNINIIDYFKYRSITFVEESILDINNQIRENKTKLQEIDNFTVTELEKRILNSSYPNKDICTSCHLLDLRKEIQSKVDNFEKMNNMKQSFESNIDNLTDKLNLLYIIKRKYNIFENLLLLVRKFKSQYPDTIGNYKEEMNFILDFDDVIHEYKMRKYNQSNLRRIKDLENKKEELVKFKDYVSKIKDIDNQINLETLKLNQSLERKTQIENIRLFNVPEEIVYKYLGVDINTRLQELTLEISKLSELDSKMSSLRDDLNIIQDNFSRLSMIIEKKQNELIKISTERERFVSTNTNLENEIRRNKKLNIFKIIFSKKIPKTLIANYMLYVKSKANEILYDVDRYKIHKSEIGFKNNRNQFDIIIRDRDVLKSCAYLSNGEENLINLAITLPLLYISTSYRILRLDEVDSFLDKNLKYKFVDKVLALSFSDIHQIFVVSHSDTFDQIVDGRVRIINL